MNSTKETELTELLSLLGDDVAEAVRAHLPDESRAVISRLSAGEGGVVSGRRRTRLLGEFERFLQFVLAQSPQDRTVQHESVDKSAADQDLDALGDDPLGVLRRVSPERFAQCVRGEHPRTIAVALDCLPPARVAELLGKLAPEVCPDVVKELGKGVKILPQVQSRLVSALARKIREQPTEKPREDDHLKRLAEVVRAADRAQRRMLVDALREQDEAAAQRLTDLLYRFEDLMTLEDRAIQQILGQVDVSTLAAAMTGAEATISERVLKNLSRRAADMLKEELQFAGRTPASRIEQARDAVAKLIAKTEQEAE
jgi:flagellar motor switch protein FliG